MPEPKEDQVHEAIVARLLAISPAGGYFTNAAGRVHRTYLEIEQVNEFPHWIVDAGGEGDEMGYRAFKGRYVHECVLDVFVYVQGNDVDPRSRWIARVYSDLMKAVLADHTLGGLVTVVEPFRDRVVGSAYGDVTGTLGILRQSFKASIEEALAA